MAFRQFQRLGRLLSSGRSPIAEYGGRIHELNGTCGIGHSVRPTFKQSVIHQRVFDVHSRQLSSLTCLISPAKTENRSSRSNHKHLPFILQTPYNVDSAWGSLGVRHFSINQKDIDIKGDDKPETKSIFQRFKDTYKEYGKVLIGVHIATSAVWFGSFYYLASTGIDIVPLLEKLGFGEKVVSALGKPGVGHVAVGYILYKLATPARYTVTVVGTQMTVKQLRKLGYLQPIKKEDSLRSLFKEGRSQVKERYGDMKDEVRIRMIARQENFTREFHTQRERFRARHSKLRNDLERRAKLRQRSHYKNGRNGHTNGLNGQTKVRNGQTKV